MTICVYIKWRLADLTIMSNAHILFSGKKYPNKTYAYIGEMTIDNMKNE